MSFIKYVKLFVAQPSTVSIQEKLHSGLAGLVGIGLIMVVSEQYLDTEGLPWVVASMGASAVLLFAAPNGPLSQPWNFVIGHLLSAFIGISVAQLIPDPVSAAAIAVALAIFAMYLTNSLHPPGGATALTAVVGGNAIAQLGYWYILTPIAINIIVMLLWALIINNLLPNRHYPNGLAELAKKRQSTTAKPSLQEKRSAFIQRSELHQALTEMDIFIDISEEELTKIFNLSLLHSFKKKIGDVTCRDIMSSPVMTVDYDTDAEIVWQKMMNEHVHAFPVIDKSGHVLGIISLRDFLNQIKSNNKSSIMQQLADFIKKSNTVHTEKPEYAGHLMSKPAISIDENQHILELFKLFYTHNIHHIPVLDKDKKLVGIITPKDLLLVFQTTVQ